MPAPKTRMCHVCGRQFGKSSIDIHIPQCIKRFEAEQAQLPPSERRKMAAAPLALGAGASDDQSAARRQFEGLRASV